MRGGKAHLPTRVHYKSQCRQVSFRTSSQWRVVLSSTRFPRVSHDGKRLGHSSHGSAHSASRPRPRSAALQSSLHVCCNYGASSCSHVFVRERQVSPSLGRSSSNSSNNNSRRRRRRRRWYSVGAPAVVSLCAKVWGKKNLFCSRRYMSHE